MPEKRVSGNQFLFQFSGLVGFAPSALAAPLRIIIIIIIIIIIRFLYPGTQFPGNEKIMLCKKIKLEWPLHHVLLNKAIM